MSVAKRQSLGSHLSAQPSDSLIEQFIKGWHPVTHVHVLHGSTCHRLLHLIYTKYSCTMRSQEY